MATIRKPRGKMTKPLATPYTVGDRIWVTTDIREDESQPGPRVGAAGAIRRIVVSDPNDGDDTFLVFYVKLDDGWVGECGRRQTTTVLGAQEFEPIGEADAWLRRQLATLHENGESA